MLCLLLLMNEKLVENILGYKEPSENFYRELEVYRDYSGEDSGSIVNCFKFRTVFGKVMFKKILAEMTDDINILKSRQQRVESLGISKIGTVYKPRLDEINKLTDNFLWFYKKHSDETVEYYSPTYFTNSWLSFLNSPVPIQSLTWYKIYASPFINVIIPILSIIGTFIAFRVMGLKVSISLFIKLITMFLPQVINSRFGTVGKYAPLALWFFFYLSNLYNTIKASFDYYKICGDIHTKVSEYVKVVDLMQSMQPKSKLDVFIPSTYCNGTTIDGFLKLQNGNKGRLPELMKMVGEVDVYMTLGDMLELSFTNFKESKRPYLNVNNLWHPYLDYNKVVKNDLKVDKGIIITGPNANGKSMTVKALGLCVLFSQTFGVGFGQVEMTPFKLLETYMNIPDCKGKDSLFEAEMHRCKNYFDRIKKLEKGQFSLIIVDEIFTGTNAKESISGAYAVCKKLGKMKQVLPVITTHYNYLTKLSRYYNNFKMPVIIEEEEGKKTIKYTYKISEGISDQFIAIDLLERKGFDSTIVKCARKVANDLSSL